MGGEAMKPSQHFITKERADKTAFVCLSDERPDGLQDFVREVHFDCFDMALPNDWIYEKIASAFDRLEECSSYAYYCQAYDEIRADEYRHQIGAWAANWWAHPYIEQAMEEGTSDYQRLLESGQRKAIEAIYEKVWSYLQSLEEEV
jgi:hypothetical protein